MSWYQLIYASVPSYWRDKQQYRVAPTHESRFVMICWGHKMVSIYPLVLLPQSPENMGQ